MATSTRSPRPVAVITGASQGLGLALATALARDGWSLVLDARRADRLEAAAAGLSGPGEVRAIAGDVTDPPHRQALAEAAAALGPVRLIVNNASTLGASPLPTLTDVDPGVLRRIFDVNVVAPVALLQALDPHLADGATVVTVTSDAGVEPYETWGGYGSSKAALEHASRGRSARTLTTRSVRSRPAPRRGTGRSARRRR